MNLFQMKPRPHNRDRLSDFLENNYVCIGWPGIGDLLGVNKGEIKKRLAQKYHYSGQSLANHLGSVGAFVETMKKDDYVLIACNDVAYLGMVFDYYYDASYDNEEDGMCHRRKVKWLNTIPRNDLNNEVQELLRHRGTITKFKYSFAAAGLDEWLIHPRGVVLGKGRTISLDQDTVLEAVGILKSALRCEDVERRERAAIALLQYSR